MFNELLILLAFVIFWIISECLTVYFAKKWVNVKLEDTKWTCIDFAVELSTSMLKIMTGGDADEEHAFIKRIWVAARYDEDYTEFCESVSKIKESSLKKQ